MEGTLPPLLAQVGSGSCQTLLWLTQQVTADMVEQRRKERARTEEFFLSLIYASA